MPTTPQAAVTALVTDLEPTDPLGARHRADTLRWLAGTDDIYRRITPKTPDPHLVSYFLPVDRAAGRVLLCDHRLAGLWLPTGGHVEPDEHPADTVRRECVEELGIEAVGDLSRPFFLTVTETVDRPEGRHTDVSLWFALHGDHRQPLTPDPGEFAAVRWWTVDELRHVDPSGVEPHLFRALAALDLTGPLSGDGRA